VVGDDDAEDRIAEELESLVRAPPRVLRAPRAVDEGRTQYQRVLDRPTEPFVERFESRGCVQDVLGSQSFATT
jgi:hypothetical protein